MKSLYGPHINSIQDAGRMIEWIRAVQPKWVKILDHNADFVRAAQEASPETKWLGRLYMPDQGDLIRQTEEGAEETFRRMQEQGTWSMISTWETANETGAHPTHNYMRYELRLVELLHNAGKQVAVQGCSMGTWAGSESDPMYDWRSNWVHEVLRVANFINLHEYNFPRMDSPEGVSWLTLRYRRMWDVLPDDCKKPLLITECGIDQGGHGGWKVFTDINDYLSQLEWYRQECMKDSYVEALFPFCFGTADSTWETYDLWEPPEAREAFKNYVISTHASGVSIPDGWIDMRDQLAAQRDAQGNKLNWPKRTKTDAICIHHTAVVPSVGPERIADHHVHKNNWIRSAYTIEVSAEGKIYLINDLDAACAGVRDNNDHIVQVCLLGSFMNGYEPPSVQLLAARSVIVDLWDMYGKIPITGHKNYLVTDCPGDTWDGPLGWKARLMPPDEDVTDWKARALLAEDRLHRIDQITEEV